MSRRWVITGATGGLGQAVLRVLPPGIEADCPALDLANPVMQADLRDISDGAEVLLHLAGLTDVSACDQKPLYAVQLHALSIGALAALPESRRPHVILMSSNDVLQPVNAYGRSKLLGEAIALALGGCAVRAAFLSMRCNGKRPFLRYVVEGVRTGGSIPCYTDVLSNPIHVSTLAADIVRCAQERRRGVVHVASDVGLSRYDLALRLAHELELPADGIVPVRLAELDPLKPLDVRITATAGFQYDFDGEVRKCLTEIRFVAPESC